MKQGKSLRDWQTLQSPWDFLSLEISPAIHCRGALNETRQEFHPPTAKDEPTKRANKGNGVDGQVIYAIGDIHGKRRMLAGALAHLRRVWTPGDRAVFLGDFIDRGEDSHGVVADLLAFRDDFPDAVFLRGNHEQMLLDALSDPGGDAFRLWRAAGGAQTLLSYGLLRLPESERADWPALLPAEHLNFLRATVPEWKTQNHHFVHAGLWPPEAPPAARRALEQAGRDPRLWVRQEFLRSEADFGAVVVFGHTPLRSGQPLVQPNKVGLDTGACFGGRLTVGGFDDTRDYRAGPELTVLQVAEVAPTPPLPELGAGGDDLPADPELGFFRV